MDCDCRWNGEPFMCPHFEPNGLCVQSPEMLDILQDREVIGRNGQPVNREEQLAGWTVLSERGVGCQPLETGQPKKTIVGYLKGAIGATKAYFGKDAASEETITERWSICSSCEHFNRGLCTECGCCLPFKIRVASERCPLAEPEWDQEGTSAGTAAAG